MTTVNDVISLQKMKAESKGIYLSAIFGDGFDRLDPFIFLDENRIKQVILNLQSNALKFTNEGSITIRVNIINSNGI